MGKLNNWQLVALAILLFLFTTWILILLAYRLKSNRGNKLTIDLQDEDKNSDNQEFTSDREIEEKKSQMLCLEKVINKEIISIGESVQLRNFGDYTFKIHTFQTQKKGLSKAECEDKYALSPDGSQFLRLVVTDGATESLFSDVWAEILVEEYMDKGDELFTPLGLESVHQKFVQKTSQYILQMPETRQWFMYEKLERGTHSTLAAVDFSSLDEIKIQTIGDSCIFWCHDNTNEVNMLPKLSHEEFGAFPASICHIPSTWQNLKQKIERGKITFKNTLEMVICTDALACWLVKEPLESQSSSWKRLFQISSSESFTTFVETLREKNNIRNDDVTLVLIYASIDVRLP